MKIQDNLCPRKFQITAAGNVIFYSRPRERDGGTPKSRMFTIDQLTGDHPVANLKYKLGWTSEGIVKKGLQALKDVGVTTLNELVEYFKADPENAVAKASLGKCHQAKEAIFNTLTTIVDKSPGVCDPNYRIPVVIPLGFDSIKIDPTNLPIELNLNTFPKDDLKKVQNALREELTKRAAPMIFQALVSVRQSQLEKAQRELQALSAFDVSKLI